MRSATAAVVATALALAGCGYASQSSTTTVVTPSRLSYGGHEVRIEGSHGSVANRVDPRGATIVANGHLVRLRDDLLIIDQQRWELPHGWRRLDLDLDRPAARLDGRDLAEGGPLRDDERPRRLAPVAAAGIARIEIIAGDRPIAVRAEAGRGDIAVDEALVGGALFGEGGVARVDLSDAFVEHATVIVPDGVPLVVTGASGTGVIAALAAPLALHGGSGAWRVDRLAGDADLRLDGFGSLTVREIAGGAAAIDARGGGKVTIQGGAVGSLRVVADGFAHVRCAATADRTEIRAEGGAEVVCAGSRADGAPADAAVVASDGFAHVTVTRLRARRAALTATGGGELVVADGAIEAVDIAADGFAKLRCESEVGTVRGHADGGADVSLPRAAAPGGVTADGFAHVRYGKN